MSAENARFTGPITVAGPPGVIDVERYVNITDVDISPVKELTVTCDEGEIVVGGGYFMDEIPPSWIFMPVQNYALTESEWHVQINGWCRLAIESNGTTDVREPIATLAGQRGWGLRELRREVPTLEDYFIKVVAEQSAEM